MNITNFFTTFISDITNSFSNLSIDKIYLLIAFIILTIINILCLLKHFCLLGAECPNPIGRMTTAFQINHDILQQTLITALFSIIFINTNLLNHFLIIISPIALWILIILIIMYYGC